MPLEYHAEVLDGYLKHNLANRYFWDSVLAALIGIFFLLQAAFRSWRLAIMTFLALPVAPLGCVILIVPGIMNFSLGAVLGLIAVYGIGIRMAVLLISSYQNLERQEGMAFGADLIVKGSHRQSETILATIFVIALAVIPFWLLRSEDGLEIVGSMAGAILAGLPSLIVFMLVVLPALYIKYGEGAVDIEEYE